MARREGDREEDREWGRKKREKRGRFLSAIL